ncbi:unnamed protein product [Owenia fusiformis]|uniref:N-terminal methionine N(alpha)-acetyltransferase NatC n=1 Tax=Owenia fusiformis TaxID=6347 RepID=A0A8J1UJ03_OWEFU|nr:unnamed protein product [Owenia fusiformis]
MSELNAEDVESENLKMKGNAVSDSETDVGTNGIATDPPNMSVIADDIKLTTTKVLPNGCVKPKTLDNIISASSKVDVKNVASSEKNTDSDDQNDSNSLDTHMQSVPKDSSTVKKLINDEAQSELSSDLEKMSIHEPIELEGESKLSSDIPGDSTTKSSITYVEYQSELQMPAIMRLVSKDLSEPYSIYTYRYFIHNWPQLCFLAMDEEKCIGTIVCKLDFHKKIVRRGYIAMLAVDKDYRRRKIGSILVTKSIQAMVSNDCDEVVLETEITNKSALRLYENLGFVRDKRLFRYYLNGVDALRLKLWLK